MRTAEQKLDADTAGIAGLSLSPASTSRTIAGIYGAGFAHNGDNPRLEQLVTGIGGRMFNEFEKGAIIKYLRAGAEAGTTIEVHGYSRGGGAAIRVANTLGRLGLTVDLLVTFDPYRVRDGATFRLTCDNVLAAMNFFQRNIPRTAGRFGFWGANPYWGSPVTSEFITVAQTDFTGTPGVNHLNIVTISSAFSETTQLGCRGAPYQQEAGGFDEF